FPRPLRDRVLHPSTNLGPGRKNWWLQHIPMLVHYWPEERRVGLTRSHLGPWGAWWLRERFEGRVPVHAQSEVVAARQHGSGLRLTVRGQDGSTWELDTDHVICGTGYEADLGRIPALEPALVALIGRV